MSTMNIHYIYYNEVIDGLTNKISMLFGNNQREKSKSLTFTIYCRLKIISQTWIEKFTMVCIKLFIPTPPS